MANLRDIFKLCKEENGRLIFLNEEGDISFVLLSNERYQELSGSRAEQKKSEPEVVPKQTDPEDVNKKIVAAQLADVVEPLAKDSPQLEEVGKIEKPTMVTDSLHIGNVLQERLREWPRAYTVPKIQTQNGNSEESIDPSFDFEGPKLSIDDI